MSAYTYLTKDGIVSRRACKIKSIIISQESSGTGELRLYDEESAEASRLFCVLYQDGDGTMQVRFDGLETRRALYADIYSRIDHVTIEWEEIE